MKNFNSGQFGKKLSRNLPQSESKLFILAFSVVYHRFVSRKMIPIIVIKNVKLKQNCFAPRDV